MSCNYARLIRDPLPPKNYGYEKVSSQELRSIIMRLQRPTSNSEQNTQFPDGYFKHPLRQNATLCRRAQTDNVTSRPPQKRCVSPHVINRVVRRLQKSTISRQIATGEIIPGYEARPPSGKSGRTSEEEHKFLRRITRPTSSSHRRDLDAYWSDMENSKYYDVDFSDGVCVTKDELTTIVDRVRTPTVSSEHGESAHCPRRKPSVHLNRDRLPLVSGLSRSRNVDDIVQRLYRPTTAGSVKRYSTESTTSASTYTSQQS